MKFVEAMIQRDGGQNRSEPYWLEGGSGAAGNMTRELMRAEFLPGDLVAIVKLDELKALIARVSELEARVTELQAANTREVERRREAEQYASDQSARLEAAREINAHLVAETT